MRVAKPSSGVSQSQLEGMNSMGGDQFGRCRYNLDLASHERCKTCAADICTKHQRRDYLLEATSMKHLQSCWQVTSKTTVSKL